MRWKRLDVPGTDSCELTRTKDRWRLEGVAEYQAGGGGTRLEYRVECDDGWVTLRGEVNGEVEGRPVSMAITRQRSGEWVVNGAPVPELHGLIDLDLGFTPATNLFPLRRLALEVGESADAEAAWVDEERWTMHRLPQRYERRDESHYWYESPTAGYSGMLRVTQAGFVAEYPGLWKADG
jgi:uncharacterized protein